MASSTPNRFDIFARARERIAAKLVVQLRSALGLIADDFNPAVMTGFSDAEARELLAISNRLRREGLKRAETVASLFSERALWCLEVAGTAREREATGESGWSLMDPDELDVQIAAGELAKRIREAAGSGYNEYVGRVASLTGRNWPVEDVQPLGTRTVAYAVCSSVRDLAESASSRGKLRAALAKHLIQPCAGVLADANAFLTEQGIEPIPEAVEQARAAAPQRREEGSQDRGGGASEEAGGEASGGDGGSSAGGLSGSSPGEADGRADAPAAGAGLASSAGSAKASGSSSFGGQSTGTDAGSSGEGGSGQSSSEKLAAQRAAAERAVAGHLAAVAKEAADQIAAEKAAAQRADAMRVEAEKAAAIKMAADRAAAEKAAVERAAAEKAAAEAKAAAERAAAERIAAERAAAQKAAAEKAAAEKAAAEKAAAEKAAAEKAAAEKAAAEKAAAERAATERAAAEKAAAEKAAAERAAAEKAAAEKAAAEKAAAEAKAAAERAAAERIAAEKAAAQKAAAEKAAAEKAAAEKAAAEKAAAEKAAAEKAAAEKAAAEKAAAEKAAAEKAAAEKAAAEKAAAERAATERAAAEKAAAERAAAEKAAAEAKAAAERAAAERIAAEKAAAQKAAAEKAAAEKAAAEKAAAEKAAAEKAAAEKAAAEKAAAEKAAAERAATERAAAEKAAAEKAAAERAAAEKAAAEAKAAAERAAAERIAAEKAAAQKAAAEKAAAEKAAAEKAAAEKAAAEKAAAEKAAAEKAAAERAAAEKAAAEAKAAAERAAAERIAAERATAQKAAAEKAAAEKAAAERSSVEPEAAAGSASTEKGAAARNIEDPRSAEMDDGPVRASGEGPGIVVGAGGKPAIGPAGHAGHSPGSSAGQEGVAGREVAASDRPMTQGTDASRGFGASGRESEAASAQILAGASGSPAAVGPAARSGEANDKGDGRNHVGHAPLQAAGLVVADANQGVASPAEASPAVSPTFKEEQAAQASVSGPQDAVKVSESSSAPASHPVSPGERAKIERAAELNVLEHSARMLAQDLRSAQTLATSPFVGESRRRLRVAPSLRPVGVIEQDAVSFAHALGVVPYSRESRHAYFESVRETLRIGDAPPAQIGQLDVVQGLFDYVIDDRRIAEASKPLVWRLHEPVLNLALLDPRYLGDGSPSVRRLIENFGAIATGFADEVVRGGELYRRLETVVRAVEIVSSALQTRSAVIAAQVDREYQRASNSVSKLIDRVVNERVAMEGMAGRRNRRDLRRRPGREREEQVTAQLQDTLRERLDHHDVPETVVDFIQNVWIRHLRTTILRSGEESTDYKVGLQVVDDLLWSLDRGQAHQSRRELAERIPSLVRMLNMGLREMGAKDTDHKAFFDELFLVHLRKMQRRPFDSLTASSLPTTISGGPPRLAMNTPVAATVEPAREENDEAGDKGNAPAATMTDRADRKSAAEDAHVISKEPEKPMPAKPDYGPITPPDVGDSTLGAVPVLADEVDITPVLLITGPDVDGLDEDTEAGHNGTSSVEPVALDLSHRLDLPGLVEAINGLSDPVRPAATRKTGGFGSRRRSSERDEAQDAIILDTPAEPIDEPRNFVGANASVDPGDPMPDALMEESAVEAADVPDGRLIETLRSVDLSDLPVHARARELSAGDAVRELKRGLWVELTSPEGRVSQAKIAWINGRRTVVLLVRHPDRRALSLRMAELQKRLERGRVRLIGD